MPWSVLTPPASEPVTLDEAKAHLRIDGTAEDAYVGSLISAARSHIETACWRAIMPQTWRGTFPSFSAVRLSGGNVREIIEITYYDAANTLQTLEDFYAVLSEPSTIQPKDPWPDTYPRIDAVTVDLAVGYTQVPEAIKQAVLLLVGHWFNHRETVVIGTITANVPHAVDALIFPYRALL